MAEALILSEMSSIFFSSERKAAKELIVALRREFPTVPAQRFIQIIREVVSEYRRLSLPITFDSLAKDMKSRLEVAQKKTNVRKAIGRLNPFWTDIQRS